MYSVATLPATAHTHYSSHKPPLISRCGLRPRHQRLSFPDHFGSPAGLQPDQFFPSRFRLPARAVRSGGPNAPQTRWRATTDWVQTTMSTIHHRTRIRAIRTSILTVMARNIITGPRSTTRGRLFFMKVPQSHTTRTCNSSRSSTTPRRIDRCRC